MAFQIIWFVCGVAMTLIGALSIVGGVPMLKQELKYGRVAGYKASGAASTATLLAIGVLIMFVGGATLFDSVNNWSW